jgi:nitroreductase
MSTEILTGPSELPAIKAARTQQPVHELIGKRWSPRAFSSRDVPEEQIISLLEAARWAPSSYNEQPWRFIVARKSDSGNYEKLLGSLMELNQLWARSAPVLILTLAKKTFTHNGTPNFYALHDAGIALGHLAIQATALGLSLHIMGGFDRAAARAAFEIPEDYELGAAVALGYDGDPNTLPERFQQAEAAPRSRMPLADLVYAGRPALGL